MTCFDFFLLCRRVGLRWPAARRGVLCSMVFWKTHALGRRALKLPLHPFVLELQASVVDPVTLTSQSKFVAERERRVVASTERERNDRAAQSTWRCPWDDDVVNQALQATNIIVAGTVQTTTEIQLSLTPPRLVLVDRSFAQHLPACDRGTTTASATAKIYATSTFV
jgi:hypothetical protein